MASPTGQSQERHIQKTHCGFPYGSITGTPHPENPLWHPLRVNHRNATSRKPIVASPTGQSQERHIQKTHCGFPYGSITGTPHPENPLWHPLRVNHRNATSRKPIVASPTGQSQERHIQKTHCGIPYGSITGTPHPENPLWLPLRVNHRNATSRKHIVASPTGQSQERHILKTHCGIPYGSITVTPHPENPLWLPLRVNHRNPLWHPLRVNHRNPLWHPLRVNHRNATSRKPIVASPMGQS